MTNFYRRETSTATHSFFDRFVFGAPTHDDIQDLSGKAIRTYRTVATEFQASGALANAPRSDARLPAPPDCIIPQKNTIFHGGVKS